MEHQHSRLMDVSDKYSIYVCNQCGLIACADTKKQIYSCKKCNNYGDFYKCNIPLFKVVIPRTSMYVYLSKNN